MRGMTIMQVADKLGMNYKTLAGILNRDAVDAKLLFELWELLNIDLYWMAQLHVKPQNVSVLDRRQMNRMSSEMRKAEREIVLEYLDRHIKENPDRISAVKIAMMKDFNHLFYLLDVLLPENYNIGVADDRGKEKYYCMPVDAKPNTGSFGGITPFREGNEMLKKLILERKGEIL